MLKVGDLVVLYVACVPTSEQIIEWDKTTDKRRTLVRTETVEFWSPSFASRTGIGHVQTDRIGLFLGYSTEYGKALIWWNGVFHRIPQGWIVDVKLRYPNGKTL